MSNAFYAVCAVAMVLTGCVSVDVSDALLAREEIAAMHPAGHVAKTGDHVPLFPHLADAARQVKGQPTVAKGASAPLPGFVADEPLVKKLVVAMDDAANMRADRDTKLSVTPGDLLSLTQMVGEYFTASREASRATDPDKGHNLFRRVRSYMLAYYAEDDGFVYRESNALKPVSPEGFKIENAQILPAVEIFFEALMDELLQPPLIKAQATNDAERGGAMAEGGKAAKKSSTYERYQILIKQPARVIEIVPRDTPGIDEFDVKIIKFMSGRSGDAAELISGAIIRVFGDIEVAFVVGGHFSFGDNETFAKVIDIAVSTSVRRLTESATIALLDESGKGMGPFSDPQVKSRAAGNLVGDMRALALE